jgi:hypothetical protein
MEPPKRRNPNPQYGIYIPLSHPKTKENDK